MVVHLRGQVETVHRLVEDEFFDREVFRIVAEFWAKVDTYWWCFNLGRSDRGKGWVTPLGILRQRAPDPAPAIAGGRPLELSALLRRSTLTYELDELLGFP